MEPVFVNQFTRSFEIEQELYRYTHLTSPSSIISMVILGVVAAVNLAVCIIWGVAYANLAVFAMAFIVLFVLIFRYYSAIQTGRKRYAEATNNLGEITVTATLSGEEIISESSDRKDPIIVPYSDIKRVFETPHYYMLQTKAKLVYVFRKGCFTTGEEGEFLPYIRRILDHNKRKR